MADPATTTNDGFFSKMGLGDIGAAALTQASYIEGKQGLRDFAKQAQEGQQAAWQQFAPSFEFKPFTVTTATGGTTGFDAQGNMTMGAGQGQALQDQLFQQAQQQYQAAGMPIGQATQGFYDQMMAAQQPELDRQRLAMEQRLAAQGRLNTGSAMYGGTSPEQLALAKAEEEARAKNYLAARQAALGEQQQAANLGSSMFTQAYLPQSQLLNAYQQGLSGQQALQAANQQYGTTGMESYLAGLDAQLQAALGTSNLTQGYMSSLADIFRPTINPKTGEVVTGTGLFGDLTMSDIYSKESGWFGLGG